MNVSRDLFSDWLRTKGLSEISIDNYLHYFDKFFYEKFNQESVIDFLSKTSNMNDVCRAFVSNFMNFLRVNYKQLNLSESDLADISSVEIPKVTGKKKQREIKVIPIDYIKLIERALLSETEKLQMLLSYYSGLRLSEMLMIKLRDINFEEWGKNKKLGIIKNGELSIIGKANKQRTVPVPIHIMERLAKYVKDKKNNKELTSLDSLIFVRTNHKIKFKSRQRTWEKVLRKAGIDSGFTKFSGDKIIPDTKVNPHKLRHSIATHLLDNNMNLKQIQEFLGHSSIQSTQKYLHISKEKLIEDYSKIID